jgi:phenylpropionate dioxygenase-like ring-hydroxylating dioxygenase large terminal subunit
MYINFWYPMALSSEVTAEKPLRIKRLCLQFVVFRDQRGRAHVLADTCVHRGGSLGLGPMRGDAVACPYHGWQFGGDGRCVKIPSLGDDAKLPARAKVDSYPVQEKYGLVFAFLGDLPEEERPPVYAIEEWDSPQWKAQTFVLDLNAYYERSIENGLDPIHNEFVHPAQGAPSLSSEQQRTPLPMEQIPWGSKHYIKFGGRKDENTALANVRTGPRVGAAGSWHQGPNQLVTYIDLTATNSFHQYLFEAPIDESHTRIYLLSLRNWLLEEAHDARMAEVTLRVVKEDMAVVENLNPVRTPDTNTREVLVPGDTAIAAYREWLKKWDAKGWKIDVKALNAKLGDFAVTIPCPARRTEGNWVQEAVPLVPGTASANRRAS